MIKNIDRTIENIDRLFELIKQRKEIQAKTYDNIWKQIIPVGIDFKLNIIIGDDYNKYYEWQEIPEKKKRDMTMDEIKKLGTIYVKAKDNLCTYINMVIDYTTERLISKEGYYDVNKDLKYILWSNSPAGEWKTFEVEE